MATIQSGRHFNLHGVLCSLGMVLGTACTTKLTYVQPFPNFQTMSLPPGCPANSAPADTSQLRACLTGLEFDTTELAGDEQRLMVREVGPGPRCHGDLFHACRYGPRAKIEPVKGAHVYADSVLDQGRIIARMFLTTGETEPYPKFGLVAGDTTYWWVHTGGPDSSYFMHRDTLSNQLVVVGRPLERNPHEEGSFSQALARWVWDETDEKANGNCGSSCCK
jgi:hypothetical protein